MKRITSLLMSVVMAAGLAFGTTTDAMARGNFNESTDTTKTEDKDKQKENTDTETDADTKKESTSPDTKEDKTDTKKVNAADTVSIRISDDIDDFTPNLYENRDKLILEAFLFRSLMGRDVFNQPIPSLVTEWEGNAKATKFTLKLDPQAKWSDGSALTSKDVKHTIEMITEDKDNTSMDFLFNNIESMETPDDNTIVINLKGSRYTFMHDIADINLKIRSSKDKEDRVEMKGGKLDVLTSGPYIIDSVAKNDKIVLKKNPEYWLDTPTDTFELIIVPDTEIALDTLIANEVDIFPGIDDWLLEEVENLDDYRYYSNNILPGNTLIFNTKDEKLSDPLVRTGLSMLIDRNAMNEELFGGFQRVQEGFFYSDLPWVNDEKYKVPEFNPQEGIKLLEKAGLKKDEDGFYLRDVEVLVDEIYPNLELGQVIVDQLNDSGIEATLEEATKNQWEEKVKEGEFMLTIFKPIIRLDPYYTDNLVYSSSKVNYGKYSNKTLDGILDKAFSTLKEKERSKYYKSAQEIIAKDMPYFPLMRLSNFTISQKNIKNLPYDLKGEVDSFDFTQVYKEAE